MFNKIKTLGLVIVIGMGLNLVGCEDVEEPEIQDTNPQVEEQINQLTDEEKINVLKMTAKNQAINTMEEKGIDCLGLKDAFLIMYAAMNDKTTTELMGLDIEVIKTATAEGILEAANYNDGTMAEDIVRMCDYIVANNIDPKDNEEYYMIMNGETWEDVLAYRQTNYDNEYNTFVQRVNEIGVEIFQQAAPNITAKIIDYDLNDTVKVVYEHMATGRNVCYIMLNKHTFEYTIYENEVQEFLQNLQ